MIIEYSIISALLLILFISIILIIFFLSKIESSLSHIDKKNKKINLLYNKIESQSYDFKLIKDRVVELEDEKGDAFQVKLRTEIKNINVDFTKLEMVVILAGLDLLIRRSKNQDDAKIYIKLIDKINSFISDIKEDL